LHRPIQSVITVLLLILIYERGLNKSLHAPLVRLILLKRSQIFIGLLQIG